MNRFTVVPEPRVCLNRGGRAIKVTWEAGSVSSLELAKRLQDSGESKGIAAEYGIGIEYKSVDDFSGAGGEVPTDGFDREEGYLLRLEPGKAVIGADSEKGRFYALQTLAQIMATAEGEYIPELLIVDWPRLKMRGFHACYALISEDLPYLAPNFELLIRLIEEYSHFKMNTVLLELEAMFPYRKYPVLSAGIAFTPSQIRQIKKVCEERHIEIIPMIQSVGHVYFALRHPEFAHLREIPDTTQQYCPGSPAVKQFYTDLVEEILAAFGSVKYLHMGGDEARRLGQCPACAEKLTREGMGAVYGDHVNELGRYLLSRGITPILWSDVMERHPEMLERLDPGIAIAYWNYSIVEWPRTYATEMMAGDSREVIGCSGAKWGFHNDTLFLYKKSMRNISIMASECARNGITGTLVTDWMKRAPSEVSIIAVAFTAETAWSAFNDQKEFCRRFSKVYFGTEVSELDRIFDLLSELSYSAADADVNGGTVPYSEPYMGVPEDYLDRFDLSGRSFEAALFTHTSQVNAPDVVKKLEKAGERAKAALELLGRYEPGIQFRKRVYEVIRLAAWTHLYRSRMGLAFDRAVRLLKYSRPGDEQDRLQTAAELRALAKDWAQMRHLTRETLLPGTFRESLEKTMDFKWDPEAMRYMNGYAELLEKGLQLKGTLGFQVYDAGNRYDV